MSHGIFAKDSLFGGGEDRDSYNEGGGERSWRGSRERQGGGERERRGGRGYRGRGRGGRGGRGGGWHSRGGGPSRRPENEDDDGDVRMEGKRWSEKGGLKKTSPSYGRGGIFSRLGGRGGDGGDGERERERGGGGMFGRLGQWKGGGGGEGGGGGSRINQWHKVTIPRGAGQNQENLIRTLQSGIDAPLQPTNVHVISDKLMFFLENPRTASQLKRLARVDVDNDSLNIRVFPSPPPRPGRGGTSQRGGFERDRDGDEMMGEPSDRGGRGQSQGGSWGRGRPWERGGRGGGRRTANYDGDIPMKQDTTTVLLACLGQRYDVDTKSLDLSSMYHDPQLKENGVRGTMYNREFVSSILELVGANCPELLALDLSSNQLRHLDSYSTLPTVCPGLKILNLSDNELQSVKELERLGGMACMTTLLLEGNPLVQTGVDVMSLANTLRKIFPNIQTVNGEPLPSPVKFDLPVSAGQLPPTQKGFVVNDEVQRLVVEFVKQYYSLYDGGKREKLFEAYSEDAVFSLSVTGALTRRDASMDVYMPLSHNLARSKDPSKRQSLVKHGRIDIVQCLRDLPPTKNHLSSFNVDVMRATQSSTAFAIYGFFSELGGGSRMDGAPVYAFTRTFVLTSVGSGIAVTNDQMTLRPASADQRKVAQEELASLHQQQQQQQSSSLLAQPLQAAPETHLPQQQTLYPPQQLGSGVPSSGLPSGPSALPSTSAFPPTTSNASFPSPQDQAIMRIAQTTSMNLEWSKKCLVENDWDFNKAVTAFTLLNGQGKIPQEAFQ